MKNDPFVPQAKWMGGRVVFVDELFIRVGKRGDIE